MCKIELIIVKQKKMGLNEMVNTLVAELEKRAELKARNLRGELPFFLRKFHLYKNEIEEFRNL